jgi:DNA-binding response OmpR family regulator
VSLSGAGFDLVLLDLTQHLPARSMRAFVALTERERVIGLVPELRNEQWPACQDFVVAPFDADEVVFRVGRALQSARPQPRMITGDLELDIEARVVTIAGRPVALTYAEFETLRALVLADGRVLSRSHFLPGAGGVVEERGLNIRISRLRAKLASARGVHIQTVRHVGYRLISDTNP